MKNDKLLARSITITLKERDCLRQDSRLDSTGECFVMSRAVLFIYFKHASLDHIKFNLPVSVICCCFLLINQ